MPSHDRTTAWRRSGPLADIPSVSLDRSLRNLVFTVAQIMRVPIAAILVLERAGTRTRAAVGPVRPSYPPADALIACMLAAGPLYVPDAASDRRTAGLVDGFAAVPVRALASMPIPGPHGPPTGVLCAMDVTERDFTDPQRTALARFAAAAHTMLNPIEAGIAC